MAKDKKKEEAQEGQRITRKEVLLARKQAQQNRQVWIGVGVVAGLLALVFVVALVNEYFIVPSRPVAVVQDEPIPLRAWQDRVRLERAQRIILLENQLEAFGGDVGIIQQFAGQLINELLDPESMGQNVLNVMIDEMLIRQAAQARGIVVTDADVEAAIGSDFNYFGGESPTPLPTPTQTIMPTPSITPLPTAVITEVLPTATPFPTLTPGPTSTPLPTATPVSSESFQAEFGELLRRFRAMGVSEETYRESIRMRIYRERFQEWLAEERALPTEDEHASFFIISYGTEEEANEGMALIEAEGYLTVWNMVRNLLDPDLESTASAGELVWRSREVIANNFSQQVAEAIFELPLNTPSELLVEEVDAENRLYYVIMVTGREIRPLASGELQNARQQLLANFLAAQQVGNVGYTGYERGRAPSRPILDPLFLTPPTPAPQPIPDSLLPDLEFEESDN